MAEFIINPRQAPRTPSRCKAVVQVPGHAFDGETEDIGPHGCQLVVPEVIAKGSILQLTIVNEKIGRSLQVAGTAMWVSSQPPWRVGVAFAELARPAAGRWFELLTAAYPGLGTFRKIPEKLPIETLVYLGPPPRFLVDFNPDEVEVLRNIASGASVFELRRRLEAKTREWQRALFSLLARGAVTISRGQAAHPESWKKILAEFEASLAADALAPPRPPLADPAPPAAPAPAPARGTGWRATGHTRNADAQEVFDQARAELAAGRASTALGLLRRALQLAPGDPEIASEMGKAMRGGTAG